MTGANNRYIPTICLLLLALAGCGGGGGGGGAQTAAPGIFSVSGTVAAASGSAVDSDVNDPGAPYANNDTVVNAQTIPNPVTVGGYVNQPGNGAAGRSQLIGDTSDIFLVTLTANQTVTLTIANNLAGDLDLFLGDVNGFSLDSSEGIGVTETLTISNAGTYLIEVYAFSGASNYTLVLGQDISTTHNDTLSSLDDFVSDEVVTRFRTPAATGNSRSAAQLAGSRGMIARAGAPDRAMLLGINRQAHKSSTTAMQPPVMLAGDAQRLSLIHI